MGAVNWDTDGTRPWLDLECPECHHAVAEHNHHRGGCHSGGSGGLIGPCKCQMTRCGALYLIHNNTLGELHIEQTKLYGPDFMKP